MSVPLLSGPLFGEGSVPTLTGGTSSSGPATSGGLGPVNIGGLFGSSAASNSGSYIPLLIGAAVLALIVARTFKK